MSRRGPMVVVAAALAALLLLGLLVEAGRFLFVPPESVPRRVIVEVANGATLTTVAGQLADAGVISHPAYFIWLGRLLNADRVIQSGDYALHTAMRPLEVMARLRSGEVIQIPVMIPEGYTAREIAGQLAAQQVMAADRFLAVVSDPALLASLDIAASSLEGYLFPSTYYVTRRTTPEEFARRMVGQFQDAARGLDWSGADRRGLTRHQIVTLASMIEKETSRGDERPLIAAVFHNRLTRRIPLQSDPTVIYALAKFDGNLRKADLKVKSPYNTYRVAGLPPGPIANPGAASIDAALHPAHVNFLYFVSKNDGTHHFSSTLAEHQKAVAQYQHPKKKRRPDTGKGKPS
jgi:UPF0755 protein